MTKNLTTGIAIAAALFIVALFFIFSNPFAGSLGGVFSASAGPAQATPAASQASQLIMQDEVVGTGEQAAVGDLLSVDYTGKLQDGTVFDTSVGKKPIQFVLGAGQVIPGWDQGLQGMKVGGKRLLVIPPDMAYGSQANGPIPANSTLIFEVQLVGVTHPPAGAKQQ